MLREKIQILYKGDSISGSLYIFIGIVALLIGLFLYQATLSLGYFYLGVGFIVFSIYMIGKGSVMLYMYYSRYRFYKRIDQLSIEQIQDEWDYVEYRKKKKNRNRRWYIYALILAFCVAIYGLFDRERGLILSICIPIILMSGIELVIGVLTQFRLHEMTQLLDRELKK